MTSFFSSVVKPRVLYVYVYVIGTLDYAESRLLGKCLTLGKKLIDVTVIIEGSCEVVSV